jgi:thiol-disulfide isomerase/thioredoxin
MKWVILFLSFISIFYSCKNGNEGISITGKITNSGPNYLLLFNSEGTKDTIKLDNEGNFNHSIPPISDPETYNISYNKVGMTLYLENGMDLTITFDADDLPGSLKFTGKGSDMNNYLVVREMKEKELNLNDNEIFKKDTATFFAWNDGIQETQAKLFIEFPKENPSDIFWKTQEADINFGWANRMNRYPMYYKYYADSTFKVSDNYYEYEDEMDINNGKYIRSGEFLIFISDLMNKKGQEVWKSLKGDSTKPSWDIVTMKTSLKELRNDTVRDLFLLNFTKELLPYYNLADIENEVTFFRENCKDKVAQAKFDKEYMSWLPIQKGQSALDFTGETIDKQEVKLSGFRGKYVYVDVWATWCGPCIYEIPFLKKLEENYNKKNIVFLSYSIDDVRADWGKYVSENDLKGVQLIGENGWQSKLCKDYKICGVPTFMLFDPDGKIITIQMTRPSDEKTRKTFDSLSGL